MDPGESLTAAVIANMRQLRRARRWSGARLANELRAVGCGSLNRSVLANLENGRRDQISVDELAALARVLGITEPWQLTETTCPPCPACADTPPPGFACLTCGEAGTPGTDGMIK